MVLKSVLITGVAGFIASRLAVHLVCRYPKIQFVGLDKLTYCSNLKNLEETEGRTLTERPNFTFVQVDLTDATALQQLFKDRSFEAILHLAAFSHVDYSFENSLTFTHNNILGTHQLLEQARQHKIERFVYISTDEVYGDRDLTSDETSPLDPTNVYSATKAAAEHLVRAYHHSFKLPVIITRGNNVYGPYQYPDKLIGRFCLCLMRGFKCPIQGSGRQQRSFLYIDDVVRAFETILFHGSIGQTYNIGSDQEYDVLEVTEKLVQLIHPGDQLDDWVTYTQDRKFNDHRYRVSSEKLKELGWAQQISFDQGLERTYAWYRTHSDHWPKDKLERALKLDYARIPSVSV